MALFQWVVLVLPQMPSLGMMIWGGKWIEYGLSFC